MELWHSNEIQTIDNPLCMIVDLLLVVRVRTLKPTEATAPAVSSRNRMVVEWQEIYIHCKLFVWKYNQIALLVHLK